jgi:hypothetical protein
MAWKVAAAVGVALGGSLGVALPLGSGCGEADTGGAAAGQAAGQVAGPANRPADGPEIAAATGQARDALAPRALPEPQGPAPDPLAVRTIELPFVPTAAAVSGDGTLLAITAPGTEDGPWRANWGPMHNGAGLPEAARLVVLRLADGGVVLDRELPLPVPVDVAVFGGMAGGLAIVSDHQETRLAVIDLAGVQPDRFVEIGDPHARVWMAADRLVVLAGRDGFREFAPPAMTPIARPIYQHKGVSLHQPGRLEGLWSMPYVVYGPDFETVEMVTSDYLGMSVGITPWSASATDGRVFWASCYDEFTLKSSANQDLAEGELKRWRPSQTIWSRHPVAARLGVRVAAEARPGESLPVDYTLHLTALATLEEAEVPLEQGWTAPDRNARPPALGRPQRLMETAEGLVALDGGLAMVVPEGAILAAIAPDGPLPVPLHFPVPQGVKHAIAGEETRVVYRAEGGTPPVRYTMHTNTAATIDETTGELTIDADQPEVLSMAADMMWIDRDRWPEKPDWRELYEIHRTRMREEFQIDIDGLPVTMYFKIMAEDATGRKAHLDHAIVFDVPKTQMEALYAERRAEEMARRAR